MRASPGKQFLVTQADLDPVINAQADEEDDKGDRYHVQSAHHQNGKGNGPGKTDKQGCQTGKDKPERAEAQVENDAHKEKGDNGGSGDIPAHGAQIFIINHRFPGNGNLDSVFFVKMEFFLHLPYEGDRFFCGINYPAIEDRLQENKLPVT